MFGDLKTDDVPLRGEGAYHEYATVRSTLLPIPPTDYNATPNPQIPP